MALSSSEVLSGGFVRDPDDRLVIVQGVAGGVAGGAGVPVGATPVTATSANQANANAVATLPGVAAKTTYITGFQLTAAGSTSGLAVTATVAGVISGTMNFTFTFPAGPLVPANPLVVEFPEPVPASAVNTAIVVTLPASGAGGTNATAAAQGFQL